MFSSIAAARPGPRLRRFPWVLWACLGLAALLTAPSSAQAQAVYVLSQGSGTASGIPQYLTVVDGATNQKGPRIALGMANALSHSMALAPDGLTYRFPGSP